MKGSVRNCKEYFYGKSQITAYLDTDTCYIWSKYVEKSSFFRYFAIKNAL